MDDKFDTDNDIIRYVKKEMMKGDLGQFIELNIYVGNKDGVTSEVFRYDERNIDNMPPKLFDLSLTRRIVAIYACYGFWEHKSDNGGHSAIIGFDIMVDESKDMQTNITAKLLDFFQALVNPFALDCLKKPFRGNLVERFNPPTCGDFFAPLTPYNPWEQFEGED